MKASGSRMFPTVVPSGADAALARESVRKLSVRKPGKKARFDIRIGNGSGKSDTVSLPFSAYRLFVRMLTELSEGHAVTLVPARAELTTQQAAELLNVSRPYLVKLLDEGKLPSRTVGKYRRVRFDDLMAYQRKDDEARAKILDRLTAEAQELGLGY